MTLSGYAVLLLAWTSIVVSSLDTEDIRIAEKADENYEYAFRKILTNYNPGTRPNVTGSPVVATVNLYILKYEEIEEVHETFTVDLYLRIVWNDYRLRHNQSSAILLQANHANRIWFPDIFFPNALKSNAPKVIKENQYIRIDSNGDVVHSKRVSLTANCHLHLRSFPLDKQKCWMHLESYSRPVNDLVLKWRNSMPVFIEDKRMPGYEITSIDISSGDTFYIGGNYSRLSVITTYTRLIGYYVFQIYIPCTLIVVSSWLSFWLSIDEPGDRVALLITTVLAIVFLLQFISATLPKVHYAKGIDYYLIGCFAQIFLGLLETVIATNYVKRQNKGQNKSHDSLKARVNATEMNGRNEPNIKLQHQHHNTIADEISLDGFAVDMATKEKPECDLSTAAATTTNQDKECDEVNVIDRVSRVVFPLTFVLFNVIYWVIYIDVIEY